MKKKKIDHVINWMPVWILLAASAYMGYKAWMIHALIGDIKPGDNYTWLIFQTWKSFFQNYMASSLIFCVIAVAFARIVRQSEETRKLTEGVNWTIERLSTKSHHEEIGSENHWPWGTHHTEALSHLEAAAKRWWTLYDPTDPSTAPTNEMVSDWLRKERNVTKERAAAIASILRADGLRTGRR
jgi:hypothetical protein